jgi:hypothetical protein
MEPDAFSAKINKLPKWARGYIHQVETFCGAEEVEELIQLRDQRRQPDCGIEGRESTVAKKT